MKFDRDPVRQRLRARGVPESIVAEGAEGLISRWRAFVAQAESGYPLGLDDYRNDLDIRGLIEDTGLAAEVEAEDERLRRILTPSLRPLWVSDVAGAFWTLGYPSNASGELLEDLEREGLRPPGRK